MTTYRVYYVLANRSLEYRCTVVASGTTAAQLRAKQGPAVDGRRRLALIPEAAYSEIAPNGGRGRV